MLTSSNIHPEYARVFEALRKQGIRFCLLRDELKGGALAKDLDLLVDNRRYQDTLHMLHDLGYRTLVTERYIPFKTALVKHLDGNFVAIDLHWEIVQNGVVYLNNDEVLSRCKRTNGYFLPCDVDFLIILIFHNVLGKGRIQDKQYPQICKLVRTVDRGRLRATLAMYGTADVICTILDQLENYRKDVTLVKGARKKILRIMRKHDRRLWIRLLVRRLRVLWRQWSLRPRAPLYAVIGVDGSGKSALNHALVELLNRQGIFTATSEYMGPWGHYRLGVALGEPYVPGRSLTTTEWFMAVFRRRRNKGPPLANSLRVTYKMLMGQPLSAKEAIAHQIVRKKSRIYLTLRYLSSLYRSSRFFSLLMLEMYYRYLRIFLHRRQGTIVITDRYIYDLMTGRMHHVVPHYFRLRKLLCRLFFRPTRVFLLQNEPEVILARKEDLSEQELHRCIAVYEQLMNQYGFFEVVRTDMPPDVLAKRLVQNNFDEIVSSLKT